MSENVTITPGPADDVRCTFTVSHPISGAGEAHFSCVEDAVNAPIAEALLSVPGVQEVTLTPDAFTVVKHPSVSWQALEEPVRYAVAAAMKPTLTGVASVGADPTTADDDQLYERVAEIFRVDVNPSVASHGGRIDLIDVQDATVFVRMQGGCQGCGMASVTLRQGIEATLKRAIPLLRGIEDITDHSAGSNPYFSAEKK